MLVQAPNDVTADTAGICCGVEMRMTWRAGIWNSRIDLYYFTLLCDRFHAGRPMCLWIAGKESLAGMEEIESGWAVAFGRKRTGHGFDGVQWVWMAMIS